VCKTAPLLPTGEGLSGVFTATNQPTFAVGPHFVFELGHDGSLTTAELPQMATGPFLHGVWGDGEGTTYVVGGDLYAYPHPMTGVILTQR
jgi:hypothetical protein